MSSLAKRRACDVCSLRKIRCDYAQPCSSCLKGRFECSYAKIPRKPGPKGPRNAARINKALLDIKRNGVFRSAESTKDAGTTGLSGPEDGTSHRQATQSPRFVPTLSRTSSISIETVRNYLSAYSDKMYAVWPVVKAEALAAELDHLTLDNETNALAYAVCAATGTQLRLDGNSHGQVWQHIGVTDQLASEAERIRKALGSQENPSLTSILIPFFLHVYYYGRNKKVAAALCLREALTLCELLHLDKEQAYESLPYAEQIHRRKIFWLLFVTERGKGMLSRTVLRPDIQLPLAEDDEDPTQLDAFLKLVQLFIAVDDPIYGSESKYANQMLTTEMLVQLQRDLSVDASVLSTNEVQRTDLAVTQHWLRMLLWQVAVGKVTMTAGDPEDPFSLRFPSHVAKGTLEFLSKVSVESLIPHGAGIESKIFEIASTLLDVINVVPAATRDDSTSSSSSSSLIGQQEPREVFHGLISLLASISDNNSHLMKLLQAKIEQSHVPFTSVPRLLEIEEEGTTATISPSVHSSSVSPREEQGVYGAVDEDHDDDEEEEEEEDPKPIQLRSLGMSDWIT